MSGRSQRPTRREMLALLAAAGAHAGLLGITACGGAANGSSTTSTPTLTNPQPRPTDGVISATTVNVTSTVTGTAVQGYCGFSYEKSAISRRTLSVQSTGLVRLFQLLNAKSVLRVGGNSCDTTVYSATGSGSTVNKLAPSDIDTFAAFAKAVNCGVIYGINLKGFLTTSPTQTVANAVAEAVYAAGALGSSLLAFEIGNEPDLYAGYTYAQYVALWDSVAAAILVALPSASFSGPAIAGTGSVNGWTVPFAAAEKARNLTLLTQHRYISATGTDATLLSDTSAATSSLLTLKTAAAARSLPWRMAETGSFYSPAYTTAGGSVAQDFAAAQWIIDYLFATIASGSQGVNLHSGNLLQSASYVPLNDDEVSTITSVNAVFYGMLLFSLGGFGSTVQTTISSPVDATAYSVQVDATHYSTWIVNKDQTSSQNLGVTLTLPSAVKNATLKALVASSASAHTGIKIQGASIGVDGSFAPSADYTLAVSGSTVTCYVPYNCVALIQSVLS